MSEPQFEDAIRKAKYGHKTWLAWRDRQGHLQTARKTPESIKRCLLDVGTQGKWYLITANDGGLMLGFWWMGINLLNQYKYGYASD